ncbi:MAG: ABC transporter ATP-binding protein, partial [Clostridia bacterium]
MKKILHYLKPWLATMSFGLLIKCIGTIIELVLPWILAHMIDDIVPTGRVSVIYLWGGVMLVCSAIALVSNIWANRSASRVASNAVRSIRHDLFARVSFLSCRQMDQLTIPSAISRLTSDSYNIHRMLSMMQRLGVRAPILLIGGVTIAMALDAKLCMVLLATLPLIVLVILFISHKSAPLYVQLQQAVDQLVRSVRDNMTGIRVIKALSKTNYEKQQFQKVNQQLVSREKRAGLTIATTNPLMNLLLNAGLTGVIVVGAYLVNAGQTETGKIIAFLSYFTIILNAMLSINRMFVLYSQARASAVRISEVLETPEDLSVLQDSAQPEEAHVHFDHVSFSYYGRQNNLTDIDFTLYAGQTLGIMGATGSGKSTLLQLLLRFYDASEGTIRIHGRDIHSLPLQELRERFGVVFQSDTLFSDTVAENIAFGRKLTHEQIVFAAKCAQAFDFIESLPDGFAFRLTARGSNLSGGQKQRLLIARALAGNPEILLLDDSSSALDYQTDARLRQALRQYFPRTTTIIVAQRISAVRHADHILVLDEGKPIGY